MKWRLSYKYRKYNDLNSLSDAKGETWEEDHNTWGDAVNSLNERLRRAENWLELSYTPYAITEFSVIQLDNVNEQS